MQALADAAHARSDVCMPWLMLPVVGPTSPDRCAQATVDVCMT